MNDFILILGAIAISILISLLLGWGVCDSLVMLRRSFDLKDFKRNIAKRMELGPIDMEMVRVFGKSPFLMHSDLEHAIGNLQIAYTNSSDEEVRSKSPVLKKLYAKMKAEQPYQEIPEKLRLPIEKIRAKLGEDADEALTPLVRDLLEFSNKKQREERWAKIFGFGGAMASIAGLAAALFFQFL